tara:strand:- start:275 stop:454 length:180 start_codon:yes stop_codon:yes gene_type:complete
MIPRRAKSTNLSHKMTEVQDSNARNIVLELSGAWNKKDFCWQFKCHTCAAHHLNFAERK